MRWVAKISLIGDVADSLICRGDQGLSNGGRFIVIGAILIEMLSIFNFIGIRTSGPLISYFFVATFAWRGVKATS